MLCFALIAFPLPAHSQSTGIKKLDDLIEELKKKTEPVKVDKNADKKEGLKTVNLPGKNLPDLTTTKENKEKAPALPAPKLPSLCRFRDMDCWQKAVKPGQQIGTVTSSPSTEPQTQIVHAAPPAESNWLKRFGKKISGAFSGFSLNSFAATAGNSLLPAAVAPAAPPPLPPAFNTIQEAKLDPHNRIGTSGEDLFSGNYHWSTPLVSLPGRNGLDLNLSLHYNSLQ